MNKYLNLVIAVLVIGMSFASCSKNDEGGRAGGGFDFIMPNPLRQTSQIQVALDVECDAMPTVRFRTEGGALGVVSPTQETKLGVEYVYAGEQVSVNYSAGRATATFWYIPLTGGNHTVTFMVEYKQGGQAQTGVNTQTFEVKDDWFGNFYPEVMCLEAGYYIFEFRNEIAKTKEGCKIYLRFGDINGLTDPSSLNITLTQGSNPKVTLVADTFYPVQAGKWNEGFQNWIDSNVMMIRNEVVDPMTMKLLICDDFNRCRDVVVKMDTERKLISSTASDYYLLPRE